MRSSHLLPLVFEDAHDPWTGNSRQTINPLQTESSDPQTAVREGLAVMWGWVEEDGGGGGVGTWVFAS